MSKSHKTQKLTGNDNIRRELYVKHIGKVRISKPTATKDLVAFDFGLWFKKDSNEINIYIDPELQATINGILQQHGELIIKTNFFSDDVLAITPAPPIASQEGP